MYETLKHFECPEYFRDFTHWNSVNNKFHWLKYNYRAHSYKYRNINYRTSVHTVYGIFVFQRILSPANAHWHVARQFLNRSTPGNVLVLQSQSRHRSARAAQFAHRSENGQRFVHRRHWPAGHTDLMEEIWSNRKTDILVHF